MKGVFEKFDFYPHLTESDKKILENTATIKDMKRGQIMIGGSNRCNGVPLVITGVLRLFRVSDKGREVTLFRVLEGELCVFGAVCLMGDLDYDFSLEAEEDCVLLIIPPDIFRELFNRNQSFKTYVFNMLAERLLRSMEMIEMLIFISIEERITEYLKQNADEDGEVKTTHEKMAIDLGTSREVITRQLNKMAEKNMLKIERGKIIIKK